MQRINFYDPKDSWGVFSNYYPSPITVDGLRYPTVEHYFQSQKFTGSPRAEEYSRLIASQSTPNKAKVLANQQIKGGYKWVQDLNAIIRQYSDVTLRPDWEDVKDNVMRKGVYQKFKQNPELRNVLLSTGDAILVEHTSRDSYWGDGGNDRGRNQLGRTLMEVRSLLRGETVPSGVHTWLIRGIVLTGPNDEELLRAHGVNFTINPTAPPGEMVVTPGPHVHVTGPQVELTAEAIGKKYVVFVQGPYQEFLAQLLRQLYD